MYPVGLSNPMDLPLTTKIDENIVKTAWISGSSLAESHNLDKAHDEIRIDIVRRWNRPGNECAT